MPSRYPQLTARCLDDGSYDPLQCLGDKCFCVHSTYGGTIDNKMYDIDIGLNRMQCCRYKHYQYYIYK